MLRTYVAKRRQNAVVCMMKFEPAFFTYAF